MSDEPKYVRKCSNWIATFEDWVMPRSEASRKFILFTAVWTIAAATRRRLKIPREEGLGSYDIYPYLFIMFVAPPGMRKTTTVGYAIDLLERIPNLSPSPTFITQAAIVAEIVKSPDGSIYLTMEEFGDLIIKGGLEMYDFLTGMYDGKKNLRQFTMMRQQEFAEKPCINLLAGTTPKWIAKNIDESLLGGGFGSRVLWVYENTLRERNLWYNKKVVSDAMKWEESLTADLIHIANLAGDFTVTEDCKEVSQAWYKQMEAKYTGPKLDGYLNRKHIQIFKVAMCLHLAYSDEFVITTEDFENAKILIESIEANFTKVFSGLGQNKYSVEMQDIESLIKEKGKIGEMVLRDYFRNAANPAMLSELIEGVLMIGAAHRKSEDGVTYLLSGPNGAK